jgi:transketolase
VRPIYVFTHDSIGVGEDGPTHQPVEQLAALRSIPNVIVLRPADANETAQSWRFAVEHTSGPVALILTRQKLPTYDRTRFAPADGTAKGAYMLAETHPTPELILMATGSEVQHIVAAYEQLAREQVRVRIVSMPSWELFERQPKEYRDTVLPPSVRKRLAVEAGVPFGWHKYIGDAGDVIAFNHFGASAPAERIFAEFGFTTANVVARARALLS